MRRLTDDTTGSMVPVLWFIIILCLVSLVLLILGEVYGPFYQLMHSMDNTIASDIDAPRQAMNTFLDYFFPKGLLLCILLICGGGLIMDYQKKRYMGGG